MVNTEYLANEKDYSELKDESGNKTRGRETYCRKGQMMKAKNKTVGEGRAERTTVRSAQA